MYRFRGWLAADALDLGRCGLQALQGQGLGESQGIRARVVHGPLQRVS